MGVVRMVQGSIITYLFMVAHLILAVMAAWDFAKRRARVFLVMAVLHFISIPLILIYEELLSLLSLPLIIVTLIILILESKGE